MADGAEQQVQQSDILRMTSKIVAAYVSQNSMTAEQVSDAITTVYGSLQTLNTNGAFASAEPLDPAVSIRSSIKPDYIVCLEDGKRLKMLKRHLRIIHNLTPEEYRAKWHLPSDYPITAPNYAEQRSQIAKKIGLGRKPGESPKKRGGSG